MISKNDLLKISDFLWEIPQSFRDDMKVPARIYASESMLDGILRDRSLEQLVNVSTLRGIQKWALAMPDMHEGYGFPIGGVAAFSEKNGIISPGGIGYDINCGVRLLRTDKVKADVQPYLHNLGRTIFSKVPSGTGRSGILKLKEGELDNVLNRGAEYMQELGYSEKDDLLHIESGGKLESADSVFVSKHARMRGSDQLGTIGSGNHFVEVDYVETIFDKVTASSWGLSENQVCVLIHTGSRGLGHQVATDYIRLMNGVMSKYGISLPDRELACVPFNSDEGQAYWKAMSAAANFAWANRQLITWEVRQAWREVFGESTNSLSLLYDVAHNIAKIEEYKIGKKNERLIVHRKGATRAFPGQPVLIPGSMGDGSYVLIGEPSSLTESFGSSCHGAGRVMSRTSARKKISVAELRKQLAEKGIVVNAGSRRGLTEEAPFAYKNLDEVVSVIHDSHIAKKVAQLRPLAVVKG